MLSQSLAALSAEPAAGQASGQPPAPKPFFIQEYQVEGNTVLPVIEIERAVTPFLGPDKTIKDIEAARQKLESVYHDRGYKTVLVDIPQQRVADGVVRLHVTEAPVGKLRVQGSRYHSLAAIRDKVKQFDEGTVPNFPEVQKELGTVQSADLHVTPKLKASSTPGKVDVDLLVEDHLPLHALIDVDNRYSANTTHLRTTGEIHYDNLFQSNQSLNLQYQIAPERPSDAKIGSLSYVIPTSSGPVWALYAIHSDSNVAAVGTVDVIGAGNIFGLRWIEPLPTNSLDFYHSFTAGVDYKDFKQSVVLEGATSTVESPVKYPAFTLSYSGTWMADRRLDDKAVRAATTGSRTNLSMDLGISFVIRGLGTDWRQFANKRAYADDSFIVLHPSFTAEEVLPYSWSLAQKIDGQLASGPLINNEQYSAGGADNVRGYVEAERLGDNAMRGSLELRTPQWLTRYEKIDQAYVAFFVDAARAFTLRPLPSQEATFSLASAGLALRFKARGLYVALDGARILEDGYVTQSGRFRGLFKVTYEY